MANLKELQQEANELGIKFAKNTGVDALIKKIEDHYESQETNGAVIEEAVKAKEATEAKENKIPEVAVKPADAKAAKIRQREAEAKKTRIVTIVDNDQRVNGHTNTCTVSCFNEYFDLGTRIIPLNEPVEVRMGHIQTLKEVKIPQHVRNAKTGLANVKLRKRYNVSFED